MNRKQLIAQNTDLKAQLDVHNHITRKALNALVGTLKKRNEELEKELHRAQDAAEGYKKRLEQLTEEK